MLKRGLLALAVIATAVLFSGAKADAIPPSPPNTLVLFIYFSDAAKTHIVGESWSGCGEHGSWGAYSSIYSASQNPC